MIAVIDRAEFRGVRSGEYEGHAYTSLTFEDEEARQFRMSASPDDAARFISGLVKGSIYTLSVQLSPADRAYRLRLLDFEEV